MHDEIGSEFWKTNDFTLFNKQRTVRDTYEKKYFVSGRTALDYILKDVKKKHGLKRAWLPSYCCHTMIEPFMSNGFDVSFYNISWTNTKGLMAKNINMKKGEILYLMEYFGYDHSLIDESILETVEIVICDRTHSYFVSKDYYSDYSYASLRKWFYIAGLGEARIQSGIFPHDECINIHSEYIEKRERAAKIKKNYMGGDNVEKKKFLDMFRDAENLLDDSYVGFSADEESRKSFEYFDLQKMKKARKRNAKTLINLLENFEFIDLMYKDVKELDVPLFVPILVKPEQRNRLRNYLTENSIYCPIHWPFSEFHRNISDEGKALYDMELSLICDQRYSLADMERQAALIERFFDL